MKNNKGFTLTEVLLAAMIVGIIGIALAALTTAALRESGVGRTRITLRNQISLFLRQLRQDMQKATSVQIDEGENRLTIFPGEVTYTCNVPAGGDGSCIRGETGNTETVLFHVKEGVSGWPSPRFTLGNAKEGEEGSVSSIVHLQLIVGTDGEPKVREAIDETFVLPQGVVSK